MRSRETPTPEGERVEGVPGSLMRREIIRSSFPLSISVPIDRERSSDERNGFYWHFLLAIFSEHLSERKALPQGQIYGVIDLDYVRFTYDGRVEDAHHAYHRRDVMQIHSGRLRESQRRHVDYQRHVNDQRKSVEKGCQLPDRSGESDLQIFESARQLQLVEHRQVHVHDYEAADEGRENARRVLAPILVHLGGHAEQRHS